jgi:glucose-1-phosphate cytidylyltransferase
MKVVILAGGLGTRISEYTQSIPKPMIEVNKVPILIHIMEHFARFGFNDFYIATGYKGEIIKKYFKNKNFNKWKINVISTGKNVMTGGRLKRLEKKLGDTNDFFLTYGDGLSNINLENLLKFHRRHNKIATISAVRPPARFGFIKLKKNKVDCFREKSSLDEGWINGGFMVLNKKIFKYLKGDQTYLERYPLEKLSDKGELYAFKHDGFWQCMDTLRDKEILEKSIKQKKHLAK